MPVITIDGSEATPPWPKGIPRGSRIRVEALPNRTLVFSHNKVSKSVSINLDPGKYIYTILKPLPGAKTVVKTSGSILVGISEENFRKLQYIKPKLMKAAMTSDGVVWRCKMPGCQEEVTSEVSAIQHEGEHFGMDLIKDPTNTMYLGEKTEDMAKQLKASEGRSGEPIGTATPEFPPSALERFGKDEGASPE